MLITSVAGCASKQLVLIDKTKTESGYRTCWEKIHITSDDYQKIDDLLNKEILVFQPAVESLLVERQKALTLLEQLKADSGENEVIPAWALDALTQELKKSFSPGKDIAAFIANNECWLYADEDSMSDKDLSPLDEEIRFKGVMMALSGTLLLYDTYMTTAAVFNEDKRIRRFLNQSDLGYGIHDDQLEALTDAFIDLPNILHMRNEIAFYNKDIDLYLDLRKQDNQFQYLHTLIQQSHTYNKFKDVPFTKFIALNMNYYTQAIKDDLFSIRRNVEHGASKFFGNTAGLVESRKGKLYDDPVVHEYVINKLQAGDILLEKTPFRLTDKMIPGHWGHAAIWVGTEDELKQLGI